MLPSNMRSRGSISCCQSAAVSNIFSNNTSKASRWHIPVVILDDYLHKKKFNTCYSHQASHACVSHTLFKSIIVAHSTVLNIQMYSGKKNSLWLHRHFTFVFFPYSPDDKSMSKRLKLILSPSVIWLTAVILSAILTYAAFQTLLICFWIAGFIKGKNTRNASSYKYGNTSLWLLMHF